jgi:hypothetical protein
MISVLDIIIEKENVLLEKNKTPKRIKLNYKFYIKLIKEIEGTKFMSEFHGMPLELVKEKILIVE